MSTTTDIDVAEIRAKRLGGIASGYEIYDEGMPDSTVPGVAPIEYSEFRGLRVIRKHPRYALVTQYGDKGSYRLHLADSVAQVEDVAARQLTDAYGAEMPICFYDLDELAGPDPSPCEGDKVRITEDGLQTIWRGGSEHAPEEYKGDLYVIWSETDTFDGEAYEKISVSPYKDADYLNGDDFHTVDEQYVEVIESDYEDERMPVCYGLARIITQVVFNTVPEPKP